MTPVDMTETNADTLIWRLVLPEGPAAIVGKELGGEYFDKAGPVIEVSVARAGVRLAAWLDAIVAKLVLSPGEMEMMIKSTSSSWDDEFEEIEDQVAQLEWRPAAGLDDTTGQVVVEL